MARDLEKRNETGSLKTLIRDFGINYGINPDKRVKATLLGTVFEYEKGRYRGFDRKTGVITDYAEIETLSVPIIIVPVMKVKKGDMILRNNEFFFVTNSENGQVYGANIFSMKEEKLLPVANPMGGEFHTKLISVGELLGFRGELTAKSKFMIWMFLRLINKKEE